MTDIHSLAGPYALDAVDDIERAAFDRHLRTCETCRAEVDELRETATRLADDAWSVPPPALKSSVMAEIAGTRQAPPAAPPRVPRRTPSRWLLTAAASVVVAATAAGIAVYVVQDQRVRDQRALAEAARSSESRVRTILAAPDLVVRESPLTGGGRVTVASSRLQNAGVAVLAATAPPTGGQVFQFWTVRPDAPGPVPVGSFAAGQAAALQVLEGLPGASAVAVTVEPAPGATTPTFPPVANVKL
jgi:anti-sigma factor RsiW